MTPPEAEPRITAVLFDLDGTFADTLPDLAAALDAATGGADGVDLRRMRHLISFGGRRMVAEALGADPDDPEVDRVRIAFLEHYRAHLADRSRPFPGITAVIETLAARGVPWGIVTNKHAWLTEPLIAALALAPGCVVSGDTAPRAKPHPDPLLLAAQRLGVDARSCVYLGDARNDVVAARAAGMAALVAGWGYLPDGEDAAGWDPDGVIGEPEALLEWLDGRSAARC